MAQRPNNWTLGPFIITKKTNEYSLQKMAWAGWTVNFKSYFSSRISNCINHNRDYFFAQKKVHLYYYYDTLFNGNKF
jgi:hypothetical protein